ncbi:MAG: CDP-alcohol phosphatidyltransferase family protein, partial [Candidatus Binataceae bacterium]
MATQNKARLAAWLIHLYTASGAVAALFAFDYTATGEFRAAFIAMAFAIVIDSTDGPLARAVEIRAQLPFFDGALLDNIVDYLNYVAAPVFLLLRAELLTPGAAGLGVASFVMLASAYGFCRVDAKTADHYFRGFPSYWNLVAFYLFLFRWPPALNTLVVALLALMVLLPIKFIYPNRTRPLRRLTLSLAAIWGVATIALLLQLPQCNR